MIKEIQAKTILARHHNPEQWFGVLYNLNVYRGCEHQCIYCDSRSECYQMDNFNDVIVKRNAPELLHKELAGKRVVGTVGTGSMSDPYTPVEQYYNLTGQVLQIIAEHRFPVHIITKSDLILKDLDTLVAINQVYASVAFTITTVDDRLAAVLEPGAPAPSLRLAALRKLAAAGIYTGVMMTPVLPLIEDNQANIQSIVEAGYQNGARFIIPWFGMSLRDRQRGYYYEKLDRYFPGLKTHYQRIYGQNYICQSPNHTALKQVFQSMCRQYGLAGDMGSLVTFHPSPKERQLTLFDD